MPTYLIGTYGPFGVMGASLFGTAAGLASDRGLGWLQVKRASPMPPFAYFAAKVITSMIFSTIIVLALFALGFTFGGVRMPFADLRQSVGNPGDRFAALLCHGPGSRILHRTKLRPRDHQPDLFADVVLQRTCGCRSCSCRKSCRQIALALPPYHLSQLALGIVGAGQHESNATHWEVLAAFTMICLGIARIGFQRDQEKMYG